MAGVRSEMSVFCKIEDAPRDVAPGTVLDIGNGRLGVVLCPTIQLQEEYKFLQGVSEERSVAVLKEGKVEYKRFERSKRFGFVWKPVFTVEQDDKDFVAQHRVEETLVELSRK